MKLLGLLLAIRKLITIFHLAGIPIQVKFWGFEKGPQNVEPYCPNLKKTNSWLKFALSEPSCLLGDVQFAFSVNPRNKEKITIVRSVYFDETWLVY
jgi:hypothetical protein